MDGSATAESVPSHRPVHRLACVVRRLPWCFAAAALALPGRPAAATDDAVASPIFADRSAEVGLDFEHFNGMSGEYYFPEMTGAGAALVDYDGDGDLDLYLVQGHMMGPGKTLADAVFQPRHPLPLTDRLYRNDAAPAAAGDAEDTAPPLQLTDVTAAAGIDAPGYGMGVATGDIDNDGWVDLYVTNFGPNQMLRNNGDGTFTDLTRETRTGDARWSVSAAFLDYDRDGWLDLYVGNYVDFSYTVHRICQRSSGARDYCGPLAYEPEPDRLFHNRGDGTFEDVSAAAGISAAYGAALGVVAADFDGDGWTDLYVANDGTANQLWINQRDGTFRDDALLAGCALSWEGQAQASMGVDAADFDGDGDEDLFMTHLTGETNTLYLNDGRGSFRDRTLAIGLASPSWNYTSFGTAWIDYDNDGRLDLLVASGAVKTIEALAQQGDPYPLHQPNQLFRNLGGAAFEETTVEAGDAFTRSEVSRGVAVGDVDNDGDADALLANNAGPARLLFNQVGQRRTWVGVRAVDRASGRDLLGTRVRLEPAGGAPLWRRGHTDGSYASALDPRVLAGLGTVDEVSEVAVQWPGGGGGRWRGLPAGRYLNLAGPRAQEP